MRLDRFLITTLLLSSCGGVGASIPGAPASDAGDAAPSADARPSSSPDAANAADRANQGSVTIHLKATTAAFPHSDGLSGQTPSDQRLAIRSLSLGSSADDPAPWIVFDLGTKAVLAGVNDGDDTVIATVPASAVKPGSYAYAKVGVAYVQYSVAATVHTDGLSVPGTFHNVEVLSNDTVIDGSSYAAGHSTFTFVVGSQTYGPVTEMLAPVPMSAGLGITLSVVDGQAAYGFPMSLDVAPPDGETALTMLANTNEDFRWMDQNKTGYAPGVFDVSPPTSFEPVEQFGANSLTLSVASVH
jgi:hypothetical protein